MTTTHARGEFNVQTGQQFIDSGDGSILGRFSLEKQFHGDIDGTGKGEMLTAGTPIGSAVYVAVERVTGTVHGKRGSFALVHRGTMTRDSQTLEIFIVPDSGSHELTGIAGTLTINIAGGKHEYDLEYTIT